MLTYMYVLNVPVTLGDTSGPGNGDLNNDRRVHGVRVLYRTPAIWNMRGHMPHVCKWYPTDPLYKKHSDQ